MTTKKNAVRVISIRDEMDDIATQICIALNVRRKFGNRHPTYKPRRLIANARKQFASLLKDIR